MQILVTSAGSEIGKAIADGLADGHSVRRTDTREDAGPDVVACDLGHGEETDRLVAGIDTVVCVCEPGALPERDVVDHHSRRTYNLMHAAAAAGVGHVVFVSSLSLFAASAPAYEITERWAPPVTPDPAVLRHYVGEFVVREFARANAFPVTCLRMGVLTEGDPGEDDATVSDAVAAVAAAIDRRPSGWTIVHVVSAGTRFVTDQAEAVLDLKLKGGAS